MHVMLLVVVWHEPSMPRACLVLAHWLQCKRSYGAQVLVWRLQGADSGAALLAHVYSAGAPLAACASAIPDGGPLGSLVWMAGSNPDAAPLLLTGDAPNRELRLWALGEPAVEGSGEGSGGLRLVQALRLEASGGGAGAQAGADPNPGPEPFFNHLLACPGARLAVLANTRRNAVYTLHLADGHPGGHGGRWDYAAEFAVTMPILSLTGAWARGAGGAGGNLQLFCVQTQAIQQYSLDAERCCPPPEASTPEGKGLGAPAGPGAGPPAQAEPAWSPAGALDALAEPPVGPGDAGNGASAANAAGADGVPAAEDSGAQGEAGEPDADAGAAASAAEESRAQATRALAALAECQEASRSAASVGALAEATVAPDADAGASALPQATNPDAGAAEPTNGRAQPEALGTSSAQEPLVEVAPVAAREPKPRPITVPGPAALPQPRLLTPTQLLTAAKLAAGRAGPALGPHMASHLGSSSNLGSRGSSLSSEPVPPGGELQHAPSGPPPPPPPTPAAASAAGAEPGGPLSAGPSAAQEVPGATLATALAASASGTRKLESLPEGPPPASPELLAAQDTQGASPAPAAAAAGPAAPEPGAGLEPHRAPGSPRVVRIIKRQRKERHAENGEKRAAAAPPQPVPGVRQQVSCCLGCKGATSNAGFEMFCHKGVIKVGNS